jgi:hypothetical protein
MSTAASLRRSPTGPVSTRCADLVAEDGELVVHALISPRGFMVARHTISAPVRRGWVVGQAGGGWWSNRCATSRRCQRRIVRGVTRRPIRRWRGVAGRVRRFAGSPVHPGSDAKHCELVTENDALDVLARCGPREQNHPGHEPDHDQVRQPKGH